MAKPKLWWQEYRRKQYKLLPVSIELILRKSVGDVTKEYMSQSSLSCVQQIGDSGMSAKRRTVQLIYFCFMVALITYGLWNMDTNILAKPLIVTMESSTYPIAKIDFPAVAICNVNRISKKAMHNFSASVYPYVALHNESLDEVKWWHHQYGRLLDFTWNESLNTHPFMNIRSKYHIKSSEISKLMMRVAPKCEEIVLRCYWAAEEHNCSELFVVRRTFRGHCCVFNYVLDHNAGGRPVNTISETKRQVEPGVSAGLLVVLDTKLEDYEYPLHNIQGFDVFLFNPLAYPDPYVGRIVHRVLEVDKSMYMELKSVKQIATDEVRKYPWHTRNCLFRDENPNYGNMYSYSTCLIHCRIKIVQSLCKCTPYFLPADIDDTELCTLENLRCLNKYKEKLLYIYPLTGNTEGLEVEVQDSMYCPDCLPDCEFTKHSTRVSKLPLFISEWQNKEIWRLALSNTNKSGKSFLSIYQSTTDGVLDRLDVVSYWFEILSSFGGFAGLVVGFSLISVHEIIYFFSIRLFQQIYVNFKRYR